MTDLVFPGLAAVAGGLNTYLQRLFNIVGRPVGSDLVVAAADAAKAVVPRDLMKLYPQIELVAGKEQEIAAKMHALISDEVKKYQLPPPAAESIPGSKGYGLFSDMYVATTTVAVQHDAHVAKDLAEIVIPLMREKFQARYVTGVTVDAGVLQANISLAKISLLAARHNPTEVERLVKEEQAMSSVLPSAFDPLGYLDALTRFSPGALTMPIRRLNCAWHFQTATMWGFPHVAVNGLMAETMMLMAPLAENVHMFGLHGLDNMSEQNVWRFLKIVVEGLDRMLAWLIDPRNFADPATGHVELLRQVQAHSAMHFLFADIAAMNYSTTAHHRISFACSALDKLANLRVQLGGSPRPESDAFKAMCSFSQRDELVRLYTMRCRPLGYDDLVQSLAKAAAKCYDGIHTHLRQQSTAATASEATRLSRLWSQRNIRHGTFLDRQQFEMLFLESRGSVPATLASLPFLLVLGLLFDPDAFLKFRPVVQP